MEIIDINYNFELYEELVYSNMRAFNDSVDRVQELRELWQEFKKQDLDAEFAQHLLKIFPQGSNGCDRAESQLFLKKCFVRAVTESIADVKLQTKKMKESICVLISLMQARIQYIDDKLDQSVLVTLKDEQKDLNKKIEKYEGILKANLEVADSLKLSNFDFQIEGEPGLN